MQCKFAYLLNNCNSLCKIQKLFIIAILKEGEKSEIDYCKFMKICIQVHAYVYQKICIQVHAYVYQKICIQVHAYVYQNVSCDIHPATLFTLTKTSQYFWLLQ